jgi:hypothetical protein
MSLDRPASRALVGSMQAINRGLGLRLIETDRTVNIKRAVARYVGFLESLRLQHRVCGDVVLHEFAAGRYRDVLGRDRRGDARLRLRRRPLRSGPRGRVGKRKGRQHGCARCQVHRMCALSNRPLLASATKLDEPTGVGGWMRTRHELFEALTPVRPAFR